MGANILYRLGGLLCLAVAAGFGWLFIWQPLQLAEAGAAEIDYSVKAFVFVPFAAVYGLFFLIVRASVPYRYEDRQKLHARRLDRAVHGRDGERPCLLVVSGAVRCAGLRLLKSRQDIGGELGQRVVASAHDDDAGATILARRDIFRVAARLADQTHDPLAALAPVDGSAEIDRIAKYREIVGAQHPCENLGQLGAHLA